MSNSGASRLRDLPKPPAFLDPLCTVDTCYYYSVPSFHSVSHPTTCWLLRRIISGDAEAVRRKLEVSPLSLQHQYFQLLDDPVVYQDGGDTRSMFHRKCLLYLTPLGLALYFKSFDVFNMLLSFRSPTNTPVATPNEVQYATHLQDTVDGDFHAFPLFMVLLRRVVFEAAPTLHQAGWRSNMPISMPLRRRYERRIIYYRDWLDAALALLATRPTFPLALLVHHVTMSAGYAYIRLPVGAVAKPRGTDSASKKSKPKQKAAAGKTKKSKTKLSKSDKSGNDYDSSALYQRPGVLPFGDQPLSVPIVGIKNLVELCDVVDKLQRTRQTAMDIRDLLREAEANGLNTEFLITQAMDEIAEDPKKEDSNENNCSLRTCSQSADVPRNSNNHAAAVKKGAKLPSPDELEHCSEPVRILLLGLEHDRCRQQCLDAVSVYHRRSYFSCVHGLAPEHGRSRDTRNLIVCLLNTIASEQVAIDGIIGRIRNGHPRWRALEAVKQQRIGVIARISAIITAVLVSSGGIVDFLSVSHPPYASDSVDFDLHSRVVTSMTSIRYGVVRDLNSCRDAWKFLTPEMLNKAVEDSAVLLHFRVGRRPSKAMMDEYRRKLDKVLKAKGSKK